MSLRPDNADIRLLDKGKASGCLSKERIDRVHRNMTTLDRAKEILQNDVRKNSKWIALLGHSLPQHKSFSAYRLLSLSRISLEDISKHVKDVGHLLETPQLANRLKIDAEYSLYLEKQEACMAEINREAALIIPDDLDLFSLEGLSNECREILEQAKPGNLAAASRLPGMTPSALFVLLGAIKTSKFTKIVQSTIRIVASTLE
ncbi:hypothetical protein EB796_021509 [Bugula neritina]|uniref:tRNA uridine 5-carboxymethylaminomethyl modification enzyme C-terminal subdomain domain-containing protein n=1 Tax=Bugula neritina TaxID=10212 RepID=A0A7J7J3H0_BUGNE|nr:hypothetical protein EB796_021509 [Bugula neritina]